MLREMIASDGERAGVWQMFVCWCARRSLMMLFNIHMSHVYKAQMNAHQHLSPQSSRVYRLITPLHGRLPFSATITKRRTHFESFSPN
jgi:hypothetical protein